MQVGNPIEPAFALTEVSPLFSLTLYKSDAFVSQRRQPASGSVKLGVNTHEHLGNLTVSAWFVFLEDRHRKRKAMENVGTGSEIAPLVVARRLESRERDVGARYLKGLVILVHLISGGSFAVAAAFTSKVILLATFWHGVMLGGVMYGLIIIVIGNG